MGLGTLDKSYQEMMKKAEELISQIENTRKSISRLQGVIVKLDRENRKLQIIGLGLASVAIIDIVLRLASIGSLI